MTDETLEERNLDLEKRRFDFDAEIKRAELKLKQDQLALEERRRGTEAELKKIEMSVTAGRGLRFTGAQATVIAAALAVVSGIVGAIIQGWTTRDTESMRNRALADIERIKAQASIDLETKKFETSLITKITESSNLEERVRNLKFYVDAGFISDPEKKIRNMNESQYPRSCPPFLQPVCARKDGKNQSYQNSCWASLENANIIATGECPADCLNTTDLVCAKDDSGLLRLYRNRCTAILAGAIYVRSGACK